jgi:hypothetical protein
LGQIFELLNGLSHAMFWADGRERAVVDEKARAKVAMSRVTANDREAAM